MTVHFHRQGYTGLACDVCVAGFIEVSTGVCQLLDVTLMADPTGLAIGIAPSSAPSPSPASLPVASNPPGVQCSQ